MIHSRFIFVGTSQFAVPAMEKLIENNYSISIVVTATDKPAGRKQELAPPPVKQAALKHNLPILQPEKISAVSPEISKLKPNLLIVAAYGRLIPKNILDIPRFGCLNLHPSLLPEYRGPSPIQTAILNGDKTSGVTVMLLDEKIDHGPIISQKKIAITPDENYQTLEKKLAVAAADCLIEILPRYLQGKIKPQKQNERRASYTKLLTRQDGQINWKQNAREIERKIRAFHPWPGAWTYFNKKRVKILKARAVKKEDDAVMRAGKDYLLLEIVQPQGKKPMTGEEFFRGLRS